MPKLLSCLQYKDAKLRTTQAFTTQRNHRALKYYDKSNSNITIGYYIQEMKHIIPKMINVYCSEKQNITTRVTHRTYEIKWIPTHNLLNPIPIEENTKQLSIKYGYGRIALSMRCDLGPALGECKSLLLIFTNMTHLQEALSRKSNSIYIHCVYISSLISKQWYLPAMYVMERKETGHPIALWLALIASWVICYWCHLLYEVPVSLRTAD